jgi:serine protease Do
VIAAVRVKSPGELAGAEAGDKIVSAAGLPISRVAQLKHVLGRMYAGDQLDFQVEREGELLDLTATLVAELLPYEHPFLGILPERGMAFLPLQEDQLDEGPESGLPIRHVFPSSPADQVGMLAGDRLTTWDGEPVSSQEEVERLLARHEPEDEVTIGWLPGRAAAGTIR